MSIDYLFIGATPVEEDCAQVGQPDYPAKAKDECRRFIAQIQRYYPEPEGGWLQVKSNPHDFGTYYEVIACYEVGDEEATKWAFDVEADEKGVLYEWDHDLKR